MSTQITIGPAVRRRRKELGWSIQRLCDEVSSPMYPGYLSDIETGKINPGVDKAYHIAQALRTTINALVNESMCETSSRRLSEVVSRVPLIPWSKASDWVSEPDISKLPPETAWELPIDSWTNGCFYMRLIDNTMQSPGSPSFVEGSLIYIVPNRQATLNDFVVGYSRDRTLPTFKKLVSDGDQQYLRSLNPQYPVLPLPPDFTILGVVTGCLLRIAKGVVL